MKKRLIALVLALAVVLCAAGCAAKQQEQDRVSITMYLWDKTMTKALSSWLEEAFPEIDFTFVVGYNTMDFYADLNDRGALPDIITCRRFSLNDAANLSELLMDLSQTEVAGTFYDSYLENNREPGGAVRWLPMCAEIDGYIANLDLFEQYDIPLPTNYGEFAEVCRQFEELGINGYVNDYDEDYSCLEALQGCAIPELMTIESTLWRRAYESETQDSPVGLDKQVWPRVFEKFRQYLLDTRTEPSDADMDYEIMAPDFFDGKTAIIRGTATDCVMFRQNEGVNCAMLPYFGETSEDSWLLTYPHCQVAVNRQVEEDPAKNAEVQRVLGALFSQEGQSRLEPSSALLSYNKNVQTELGSALSLVEDCVNQNHLYMRLASTEFFSVSADVVRKMIRGEYGAQEAYADFDAKLTAPPDPGDTRVITTQKTAYEYAMGEHGSPAASAVINTAREQFGADVAIGYSSVVAAPVFAGDYTEQQLHWLTANRLRIRYGSFTGGELIELMQWLVNVKEDGSNPIRGGLMPVTSALEYTVATDGTGEYTLTRVTRDGRSLDEDAVYSVLLLGDLNYIEASYYCNCPIPQNLADKLVYEGKKGYTLLTAALKGGNQLEKPTDYVTIRSR
ncbi:MAG: hypothetical protein Q4F81_12685 [Eubacteriales bacterium]|nr:hypothetical protein [Eubacteriales bacterium]